MDSNKNIIAAISLSAAIIVLWALFFSPSPEDREKIKQKRIDSVKSLDAPEIENSETIGISSGASAPENLVQNLLDNIRKDRKVSIEEVIVAEEKVVFKLPKELN